MHALVLQCGGPTAVVNRSLAALVRHWRVAAPDGVLHGGRHGLRALITGDWQTLTDADEDWLAAMEISAGMALRGGRDRLTEADIDGALALLAARSVGTLFLIGGNGTMAAGRTLSARAAARLSLRVIGIPKTIDNDIPQTDVCPGFPSAANFLMDAVRDVGADVASMRGYEDVVLIETMGRHTGWLAAATRLARAAPDDPPHVVLVPEEPFDEAPFLGAVRERHQRAGICVASVAEGVRDRAAPYSPAARPMPSWSVTRPGKSSSAEPADRCRFSRAWCASASAFGAASCALTCSSAARVRTCVLSIARWRDWSGPRPSTRRSQGAARRRS